MNIRKELTCSGTSNTNCCSSSSDEFCSRINVLFGSCCGQCATSLLKRKDKNMIKNILKIGKLNLPLTITDDRWMIRFLGPWRATIRAMLAIVIWVYWFYLMEISAPSRFKKMSEVKMKMPQQQTNNKMAMISVSKFNFGKLNDKHLIIWQFWGLFGYIFLKLWSLVVLYKSLIKIFILC